MSRKMPPTGRTVDIAKLATQAMNAHRAGALAEAVKWYRAVIAAKPDFAMAYANMAGALTDLGRLEEAVAACRRAIALQPGYGDAYNNLGTALHRLDQANDAAAAYRQAIAAQPEGRLAYDNLVMALAPLGRQAEAIPLFRQFLAHRPADADAHNTLGNLLSGAGAADQALAHYRQAVALAPDFADARNNLATQMMRQSRFADAVEQLERVVALRPDSSEVHYNLGCALQASGVLDRSLFHLQRAVALKPDFGLAMAEAGHQRRHACDWRQVEADDAAVLDLVGRGLRLPPFMVLCSDCGPAEQLSAARTWASGFAGLPAAVRIPRAGEKIRLGYLSADFHEHATAYLIAEIIERHHRDRFEVNAYSIGPADDSPMRQRLAKAFDRFTELGPMSDEQAAAAIAADGVDILLDLKGYTQGARSGIAARRPAPIQVNYLGYPGTMGAGFIDYLIADPVVVPAEEQSWFSEKIVHLPGCYQPNDSRRAVAAETPSRQDCGLPETGFVFCSFNNAYKVRPAVFDIWMRLLAAVPGSVLWQLEPHPLARDNLRAQAAARGIDPARLVFAPRQALDRHLARQRLADLFLDTLPVSAHTTASDALWVGLPVLTCRGSSFIGRVSASLLTALELPELITTSLAEYEAAAVRLATRPAELAAIRERLAENRRLSPAFDPVRYTDALETVLGQMWEIHMAGQPPRSMMEGAALSPVRLNVGCGRNVAPGWINVDCAALPGIDIVADLEQVASQPLPLADDSVDEFLLSHVIEHIRGSLELMQELHRVAKPGAIASIRVPHGANDEAWEDPTHVRPYFFNSFGYFSQPFYWRADYGYRGDWRLRKLVAVVSQQRFPAETAEQLLHLAQTQRNVISELIAEMEAVKPIREPKRELMDRVVVEFVKG